MEISYTYNINLSGVSPATERAIGRRLRELLEQRAELQIPAPALDEAAVRAIEAAKDEAK